MRATRLALIRKRLGAVPTPSIYPPHTEIPMPQVQSVASLPTTNGSRYLQQLCKHWSHNLTVDFTADAGTVTFPHDGRGANWPGDGKLALSASEHALECRLEASCTDQLSALKGAVERHLERFAFREAPLSFTWQDA